MRTVLTFPDTLMPHIRTSTREAKLPGSGTCANATKATPLRPERRERFVFTINMRIVITFPDTVMPHIHTSTREVELPGSGTREFSSSHPTESGKVRIV